MGYDIIIENKIKYITFEKLRDIPFVKHGFSTRIGGISGGVYSCLNLGLKTDDESDNVKRNIRGFASAVGVNYKNLVISDQVHGDTVKIINNENIEGKSFKQKNCRGADALVTNVPNIPLMGTFADCVPIFFVDIIKKVIGVGHAGWKGTKLKIGKKIVQSMINIYGSKTDEIIAVFGPSIGKCCYEVDNTVVDQFNSTFTDTSTFIKTEKVDCHCSFNRKSFSPSFQHHLDLWEANRIVLNEAGLPDKNIIVSNLCTGCNTDLFYSYRKEKGNTGRMGAIIQLT